MKKFYVVWSEATKSETTIYSWQELEKIQLPFFFKAFTTKDEAQHYVQQYVDNEGNHWTDCSKINDPPSADGYQSYPDVQCRCWCRYITCSFLVGIGLFIPGILFLTRTARIPERWSAVQCFVGDAEKETTPQANPLEGDVTRVPYNSDGFTLSPSSDYVCQLNVRVVYPPNIFTVPATTTATTVDDGREVLTYNSGPIPTGFAMPQNGTHATMYTSGRPEKGSRTTCWDLLLPTKTQPFKFEVEVPCEIFNASALKAEEFPNPAQTLLYMGDYVASPNSLNENIYDPNHVKYSNQIVSNPLGLASLLVGCFLLLLCWAMSAVHFAQKFYRDLCIQYMCCRSSKRRQRPGDIQLPSSSHSSPVPLRGGKLKRQQSNPL